MSKTIIRIENLTINFGTAQPNKRVNPFELLFGMGSFGSAGADKPDADHSASQEPTGDTAATSTQTGEQATHVSMADLTTTFLTTTFLTSNPDYKLRSVSAVAEHLGVSVETAMEVLCNLEAEGKVHRKTRRGDGVILFGAQEPQVDPAPAPQATPAPEAAPATQAPATVTVTTDDIVAFLRSDERYDSRSDAAITKNFAGADPVQLDAALQEALNNEEIETRTRRRDGATLYTVA